jgi:hypothetical protein
MEEAIGVWAERGAAATKMAATMASAWDGVLRDIIGSLLAIAYDRIKDG